DDNNDDEDDDDNDEEEELAKSDEEDAETGKGGDEVRESEGESDEEETRQEEEESFDSIPRTPEESKEESNAEEDQDLRLSEEARIQEEEDADELYRDVNINQGRGLQVTQNVENSHVTLTPVNPDGPQESSSMSPLLPDRAWNTTMPAAQGDAQSWISDLARQTDARSSFNELLDTPIDFSNFIMNRLNVDTLTPDLLAGPTYELMRGSCTSLTVLEYHLEEVYKATTDQLDWVNPEGQQYLHNLLQPLPLIPDNRGRRARPLGSFSLGAET
nr:hypothetical protein [Tanacetum cinerariifolium]